MLCVLKSSQAVLIGCLRFVVALATNAPMDMIEVRAISFTGKHGCYPEERQSGRRFEVDVVVWFDMQKAAASDRLIDTIDSNQICETVFTIGTQESFHLIERLAYEMTAKLLLLGSIERVKVVVRKYVPELVGGPSFFAAIVERARALG